MYGPLYQKTSTNFLKLRIWSLTIPNRKIACVFHIGTIDLKINHPQYKYKIKFLYLQRMSGMRKIFLEIKFLNYLIFLSFILWNFQEIIAGWITIEFWWKVEKRLWILIWWVRFPIYVIVDSCFTTFLITLLMTLGQFFKFSAFSQRNRNYCSHFVRPTVCMTPLLELWWKNVGSRSWMWPGGF
jgi:hypothetical protein